MTAIQAELIGYKTLQVKKCMQITLEVPLEHAQKVTEALGWPYPGESLWVAVMPLKAEEAGNDESGNSEQPA